MKRVISLLIGILGILTIVLLTVCFQVHQEKKNVLAGEKLTDFLYYYPIDLKEKVIVSWAVKDNNIYYLTMDYEKEYPNYILNKLDIFTNKVKEIKNMEEHKDNCYIKNDLLICDNYPEGIIDIYNLDYEKIYHASYEVNIEKYIDFVPYKDTFLTILDDKIYINQDGQNKEIRDVSSISTTMTLVDYYYTKDNVYLLFSDYDKHQCYVYNYNKKTFDTYEYKYFDRYDNGFYFYSEDSYKIVNIKDNKIIDYKNELRESDLFTSTLKHDDELLVTYDLNSRLKLINIKEKKMKSLDINELNKEHIMKMVIKDNYLYIESMVDTENKLFILDLSKIGDLEESIIDYNVEEDKKLAQKVSSLENNYGIKIHIKDDGVIDFPDFSAEKLLDNKKISSGLEKIETILKKYNKEFFDTFIHDDYKGLNIYVTSTLKPANYETQISNPAAYSLVYNNEFMIAIDITQSDLEKIFCHELLHVLENGINFSQNIIFPDWDKYNPAGFSYNYEYVGENKDKYTMYHEDNKENVYFISSYAYTYPTEDRADVFGSICGCDKNSDVNEYPNLYKKASYLKEEILRTYPMLENTTLFNSMN